MQLLTDSWNEMAEILREEFQEYGGVLCLLTEQQQWIMQRDIDALTEKNIIIEEQMQLLNSLRIKREQLTGEVARSAGKPEDMPLKELLLDAPDPSRPMFYALIDGAEQAFNKIRRKIEQNRSLLERATDLNQQILQKLQPQKTTKTYNRLGGLAMKNVAVRGRGLNMSA